MSKMVQIPHSLLESVFESPGNRVTVVSTIVTLYSSNFHVQ